MEVMPPPATLVSPTPGEVFALIRDRRATTRGELGRLTGLSRTAVTARVAALEAGGLVIERDQASTGGRPAAQLMFNVDAGVVFSAAIGRSRTQLAVCNLDGTILASTDIDQEPGIAPDDLLPDLVKRLDMLLTSRPAATHTSSASGSACPARSISAPAPAWIHRT